MTRIDAMRTGELETHETHELQEHLGLCPSCHESVDDVRQFASAIRSLTTQPTPSLKTAVTSAVCDSFDTFDVGNERVWVAFSPLGIRMIELRSRTAEQFRTVYRSRFGRELREGALPHRYRVEIESAILGGKSRPVEVDLTGLTEFEKEVLQTIVKIPRGQVRPYSWVAAAVRRPKASRAVGTVMARNPIPFILPCHRVVPVGGGVGSYGFGSARKRAILTAEGTPVSQLDALARKGVRYLGSKTTRIFCLPTCSDARCIREANLVDFHDQDEAKQKGYRPCKRCSA